MKAICIWRLRHSRPAAIPTVALVALRHVNLSNVLRRQGLAPTAQLIQHTFQPGTDLGRPNGQLASRRLFQTLAQDITIRNNPWAWRVLNLQPRLGGKRNGTLMYLALAATRLRTVRSQRLDRGIALALRRAMSARTALHQGQAPTVSARRATRVAAQNRQWVTEGRDHGSTSHLGQVSIAVPKQPSATELLPLWPLPQW
mmetsp:Transcript_82449/g.163624  ORF Transcript_82449/g.163624 Transcript_82449/m.163624 type:complete len:200 (+) Transcript_82449:193-792(+)